MPVKPLKRRGYGSIPHLPDSRMGSGDHKISEGQTRIATEEARDSKDFIIVQEKLDGSNVSVAKIKGELVPLTRAGYHCKDSFYKQHHVFVDYVDRYRLAFNHVIKEGQRIVGEWLYMAHGTRYKFGTLDELFIPFDIMSGTERMPYEYFECVAGDNFELPHLISKGCPVTIKQAMKALGKYGYHGALDKVEGAVWRVEREGKVDFLCKYVRPNKKDGCYIDFDNEDNNIYNWEF